MCESTLIFLKSVLSLFALERLHLAHNTCRFSSVVLPPRDRGIIWSISRYVVSFVAQHKAHRPFAAFNTPYCIESEIGSLSKSRLSHKAIPLSLAYLFIPNFTT